MLAALRFYLVMRRLGLRRSEAFGLCFAALGDQMTKAQNPGEAKSMMQMSNSKDVEVQSVERSASCPETGRRKAGSPWVLSG
jgi:hypothetical protein